MIGLASALLLLHAAQTAPHSRPDFAFPRTIDPGGCIIELIASDEDRNHHQFAGSSPDGRLYAAGWYIESDGNGSNTQDRRAYLLDLESGERTEIPPLDNVASFSPDGSQLISAAYQDNGRTDLHSLHAGHWRD